MSEVGSESGNMLNADHSPERLHEAKKRLTTANTAPTAKNQRKNQFNSVLFH